MKARKLRVLMDLSMGLMGYNGIPQDVRLLYKTLASCPDVELTGLIYPLFARTRRHRFERRDAPLADRLVNQSCFLWGLTEGPPHWPYPRPVRALARMAQVASRMGTRSAQLDPLITSKLWPAIWRTIFSQTLSAEDIPLIQDGKFLLTNISGDTIYWHVLAKRRPVRIDTRDFDFVIMQTARPLTLSSNTRLIVRYHDMIPVTQPDTTPRTLDIKWHHRAIRQCTGGVFVCNSDPTRDNLTEVYPELKPDSVTIPYMLPQRYWPDGTSSQVRSIVDVRRSDATGVVPRRPLKKAPRYLMGVSTLEPRKNFIGLIQAYNALRMRASVRRLVPDLKLLIVGGRGWKFEPILDAMREPIRSGHLIHLEKVTTEELRVLYSHAEALVYPSNAEGFGFPPLEAMQCGTPAVVSDIPEHRWVLGDAALYCNSYDVHSIVDAVERLIASEQSPALKRDLLDRAQQRIERYSLDRCRGQWLDLMERLHAGRPAAADETPAGTRIVPHGPMERAA